MVKRLGAALIPALVLVGIASASPQKDTFALSAKLTARSEVPRPTGVRVGAAGTFTGKVVELENDRARLTWRLAFTKLTGRALASHIHVGKAGKAGAVMVGLCGPCRNGQRGTATMSHAQLRIIRTGRAYVNVHTSTNAAGEIRGQVKATETSSGSSLNPPPPPPPSPPTPPPPYP
jgi:hypothetical protein